MSASREKKQRQVAGPSEKASQAQAKQTAYKKKVRSYSIIAIVVVVLIAALLFWNTGIIQKDFTAATVGDTELSVSDLSFYYYTNQTRYYYSYYGISDHDVYDSEKGTTFGDYFLTLALTDAQEVLGLYKEALANGYSDADVADEVAEQIASVKANAKSAGKSYRGFLKASFNKFMTPSAYETAVTRALLADKYYTDVHDETYESYTEKEFKEYYAEHADEIDTITYSYLYFKAATVSEKDEDGNKLTDEELAAAKKDAMEAAKKEAQAALDSYNGGTDLETLIKLDSVSSSGDHTTAVGSGSLSSVYAEDLLKLDADEAALVEYENNGYYVVIYHSQELDETLSANVRHILFKAETTTDSDNKVVAPSDEAWAEALAAAESVLEKYTSGDAQTPEAFGELANKYSEDSGSNTNGGLYENVLKGDFITEFDEWLFGEEQPEAGETGIVKHVGSTSSSNAYWGYHVTYLESWGEAAWMVRLRDTLTDEAMSAWQEELTKEYPAELASAANNIA